jgi:hypothetical protein
MFIRIFAQVVLTMRFDRAGMATVEIAVRTQLVAPETLRSIGEHHEKFFPSPDRRIRAWKLVVGRVPDAGCKCRCCHQHGES